MIDPVLDQIYEICKYNAPVEGEERDMCFDGVLCVLLYKGLLNILPELKTWIELDTDMVNLKRVDVVNELVDYATSKELDENTAFSCAGLIARNINKENLNPLINELEQLHAVRNTTN